MENPNQSNQSGEDVFSLIEKGNSLESSQNKWGSSEYYAKASSCLLQEYHSMNSKVSSSASKDASKKPEKDKIAALYHDQSVEYLNKARKCLIRALMFEREEDLKRWGESDPMVERMSSGINNVEQFVPLMNFLTSAEKEKRMNTFHRLFVAPMVENKNADNEETSLRVEKEEAKTLDEEREKLENRLNSLDPIQSNLNDEKHMPTTDGTEEHLSLQERLARLDSTLPDSAKKVSDDERWEKIKNGLGDLGIYAPTENRSNLLIEEMTDDEQIQMITNMAKDEAALDKKIDRVSNDESVEEIMKRSGIRFELPDDKDLDDDLLDPNDAEVAFWSTLEIQDGGNNASNEGNHYPGIDLHDDNNDDFYTFENVDDFQRAIAKSQQMLLQANICLDEIDFTIKEKKIPLPEGKGIVVTEETVESVLPSKGVDCVEVVDEKVSTEHSVTSDANANRQCELESLDQGKIDSSTEEESKIPADLQGIEDVESDHNEEADNCDVDTAVCKTEERGSGVDIKNDREGHVVKNEDPGLLSMKGGSTTEEKQSEAVVEGDRGDYATTDGNDAGKPPLGETSNREEKGSRATPEGNYNVCEEVDDDAGKCGDNARSTTEDGQLHPVEDTVSSKDMERMKSMGKESIIKAYAILGRIIKAWPDDDE